MLLVSVELSSSAANISQLLAAEEKLSLVLGLGAVRASLAHSAAHFRYLREASIACMGAPLAFTSLLAIQYRWCPLPEHQPGAEIARRCVNQYVPLPPRRKSTASSLRSMMPSAGSICEGIGRCAGSTIWRVSERLAGASQRGGILDAMAQAPRNSASTLWRAPANPGIACRQPADRGPVELVASLREQGYEPIVKEACER
jgi:hypothetical protein